MWDDLFFQLDDGVIDQDGAVLCPVCGCCSLKRGPKFTPSLMTQVEMISRGEEWTPKEEDLVWKCSGGYTKTERHA